MKNVRQVAPGFYSRKYEDEMSIRLKVAIYTIAIVTGLAAGYLAEKLL